MSFETKKIGINTDVNSSYYLDVSGNVNFDGSIFQNGIELPDGDVKLSGTPVLSQIAIWKTADTIEGKSVLTLPSDSSLVFTGEYISDNGIGLRVINGNYGSLVWNDGNYTYLANTASGDIYGSADAGRPLVINNGNGFVGMGGNPNNNYQLYITGSVGVNGTKLLINGYEDLKKVTAPATPASGYGRLYVDTTDSKIKFKDDAGTVYDLTSSGGGGTGDVTWASGSVGSANSMLTANGDGSIVADSSITWDGHGLHIDGSLSIGNVTYFGAPLSMNGNADSTGRMGYFIFENTTVYNSNPSSFPAINGLSINNNVDNSEPTGEYYSGIHLSTTDGNGHNSHAFLSLVAEGTGSHEGWLTIRLRDGTHYPEVFKIGSDGDAYIKGSIDANGTIRSTSQMVPSDSSGTELIWSGAAGYLFPYNRTTSVYAGPMNIRGTTVSLDSASGGTARSGLDVNYSGFVFNEDSYDMDFRIESNVNSHAFFLDGATSKIIVGENSTSTPYKMFNVHANNTDKNVTTNVGMSSDDGNIFLLNPNTGSGVYANIDFATNDGYTTTYNAARIAWKGYTDSSALGNYMSYVMYDGGMKEQFRMTRLGDFHANGDVIAYSTTIGSDIRLKENVKSIEGSSLDKIMKLRPVSFNWKNKSISHKSLGFIAQELEEYIPEVISENVRLGEEPGVFFKHIRYNELIPHLTKSIQEQQKIIIEQQKDINELKQLVQKLMEKI